MVADKEFQRSAWFERGPNNVFSPDELVSEFFDDLFFEEFLTSEQVNLNEGQRLAGRQLWMALEQFSDSTSPHLDPVSIFEDSRWDCIRKLAANFLESLRNDRIDR
jgi:hypothetical protein